VAVAGGTKPSGHGRKLGAEKEGCMEINSPKGPRWALATCVLLGSLLVAGVAWTAGQSDLAAVRQVTAGYHDPSRAVAAGHSEFLDCFEDPRVGGMGQHYVQLAQLDGRGPAPDGSSRRHLVVPIRHANTAW
jgi:hypothetical protein